MNPFRLHVCVACAVWSLAAPVIARTADLATVDFRYAPPDWQTCIGLPDDWQKTLVNRDGGLLYDYPGKYSGFSLKITATGGADTRWLTQELVSPRVPIVRTLKRSGAIEIEELAFAIIDDEPAAAARARTDLLLVRLRNPAAHPSVLEPILLLETDRPVQVDRPSGIAVADGRTTIRCGRAMTDCDIGATRTTLRLDPVELAPNASGTLAFAITRGEPAPSQAIDFARVEDYLKRARHYWETLDLPYDHLEVPDPGIQALLDSAIRNIYQAREIKKGLPAFQVGPTCYRGLWVVDGAFLMESVAFLGRTEEARKGIQYLLGFQRDDGGFMLIDGHWKETGIVLWAVTRHARLTGDRDWLRSVWPQLERGFNFIRKMRTLASQDPNAPNDGLVPDGFSDGGLGESKPEYTNVYWTMAGLRAAVDAARWLGLENEARDWQREADDFMAAFRRAAARDLQTDPHGNRYLPIRMKDGEGIAPQRAQWAFLHAVFPGQVFPPDDPLVRGNLAMLEATEREGMVFGTGWLADGIWNYFASFYAHAWLWQGRGDKAAASLYAFANHASPLLCWREEQMPQGAQHRPVGDMPHNWASAEFIRLVRHSLVLERGPELHLCEALPAAWIMPGKSIRVRGIQTDFGPLDLTLRTANDGSEVHLDLRGPKRNPPTRIVLHLAPWSGRTGTLELPVTEPVRPTVRIQTPTQHP